jgi:hypothetical protein
MTVRGGAAAIMSGGSLVVGRGGTGWSGRWSIWSGGGTGAWCCLEVGPMVGACDGVQRCAASPPGSSRTGIAAVVGRRRCRRSAHGDWEKRGHVQPIPTSSSPRRRTRWPTCVVLSLCWSIHMPGSSAVGSSPYLLSAPGPGELLLLTSSTCE